MIKAKDFLDACKANDFNLFSGTPCSYLKPLINAVIDDNSLEYRGVTNEGDAVALVSGASMTGTKGVVMFQNSGLGNAVNALTSLAFPFRFPFLMIVTHRGQPGGPADEPQHELMGQITEKMLETMQIKWEYFPTEVEDIAPLFERLNQHLAKNNYPFALVMRKGAVEKQELQTPMDERAIGLRQIEFSESLGLDYSQRSIRTDALKALLDQRGQGDLFIATTGKTGRELFTLTDEARNLYMVGSMGSCISFSLGLALKAPKNRVFCIDGDAAVLMRMGNLVSVGQFLPPNLIHIVLDNEVNDSTGGQTTPSRNVALAAIAKSCGYSAVFSTDQLQELSEIFSNLQSNLGPVFIHFRIKKGSPPELGRPDVKPYEVKERMMSFLREFYDRK